MLSFCVKLKNTSENVGLIEKSAAQSGLQAENRGPENTIFVKTRPKASNMHIIRCAMMS